MLPAGVPSLGLSQDASTYFDLHHTANDTLDKIDPQRSWTARRRPRRSRPTSSPKMPETLARIPAGDEREEPE